MPVVEKQVNILLEFECTFRQSELLGAIRDREARDTLGEFDLDIKQDKSNGSNMNNKRQNKNNQHIRVDATRELPHSNGVDKGLNAYLDVCAHLWRWPIAGPSLLDVQRMQGVRKDRSTDCGRKCASC